MSPPSTSATPSYTTPRSALPMRLVAWANCNP
jgi:hypothetical protein